MDNKNDRISKDQERKVDKIWCLEPKKKSRSSFRKKSQTIRNKETGPNLWIFESEECLEVLKQ